MLEENIQKQIDVLIERYPQIDKCKKELKQLRFQILDQFVLYSLGKKEKSTWILQTEQIVEKMNMINNKDVLSRLFQAYLLVEQEKLNLNLS